MPSKKGKQNGRPRHPARIPLFPRKVSPKSKPGYADVPVSANDNDILPLPSVTAVNSKSRKPARTRVPPPKLCDSECLQILDDMDIIKSFKSTLEELQQSGHFKGSDYDVRVYREAALHTLRLLVHEEMCAPAVSFAPIPPPDSPAPDVPIVSSSTTDRTVNAEAEQQAALPTHADDEAQSLKNAHLLRGVLGTCNVVRRGCGAVDTFSGRIWSAKLENRLECTEQELAEIKTKRTTAKHDEELVEKLRREEEDGKVVEEINFPEDFHFSIIAKRLNGEPRDWLNHIRYCNSKEVPLNNTSELENTSKSNCFGDAGNAVVSADEQVNYAANFQNVIEKFSSIKLAKTGDDNTSATETSTGDSITATNAGHSSTKTQKLRQLSLGNDSLDAILGDIKSPPVSPIIFADAGRCSAACSSSAGGSRRSSRIASRNVVSVACSSGERSISRKSPPSVERLSALRSGTSSPQQLPPHASIVSYGPVDGSLNMSFCDANNVVSDTIAAAEARDTAEEGRSSSSSETISLARQEFTVSSDDDASPSTAEIQVVQPRTPVKPSAQIALRPKMRSLTANDTKPTCKQNTSPSKAQLSADYLNKNYRKFAYDGSNAAANDDADVVILDEVMQTGARQQNVTRTATTSAALSDAVVGISNHQMHRNSGKAVDDDVIVMEF